MARSGMACRRAALSRRRCGTARLAARLVGDWWVRDCRLDVPDRDCLERREIRHAWQSDRAGGCRLRLSGPGAGQSARSVRPRRRSRARAPRSGRIDPRRGPRAPAGRGAALSPNRWCCRPTARPELSRPDARTDQERPGLVVDASPGRAVQLRRRAGASVLLRRVDARGSRAGIPPLRRTIRNDEGQGRRSAAGRRRLGPR